VTKIDQRKPVAILPKTAEGVVVVVAKATQCNMGEGHIHT